MTAPIVVFRADASVDIGTGHVMRCLTLATALQARGARCHFLCRDLPGHLEATIRAQDFDCHLLPAADRCEDDGLTAHSRWLGVSGLRDASESRSLLDQLSPDWVVLDHYALDAAWERAARPDGAKLMVIDDLADRPHDCDLLLDQNLGRDTADYDGLLQDRCFRLIGPAFALLREEFAAHRAESLARRTTHPLRHILVSLGGVDRDNVTSRVLARLASCRLHPDTRITVVIGRSAPGRDEVARQAAQMPVGTEVCMGATNMAALMTRADLAIGAGGSTSWERCCLGLPTLLVVLAPNQEPAARALSASGAAVLFGDATDPTSGLADAIASTMEPRVLAAMSVSSADLVDGLGAHRVVGEMEAAEISVRLAREGDAEAVYLWRYAGDAARNYRTSSVPTLEAHVDWFRRALHNDATRLLIAGWRGQDVGHIRFDLDPQMPGRATVGICIDPEIRSKGRSTAILRAALRHGTAMGFRSFLAEIHEDNRASMRIFERLGFFETARDGPFRTFLAEVSPRMRKVETAGRLSEAKP